MPVSFYGSFFRAALRVSNRIAAGAQGIRVNDDLRDKKEFRNPGILELLMDKYHIRETGSVRYLHPARKYRAHSAADTLRASAAARVLLQRRCTRLHRHSSSHVRTRPRVRPESAPQPPAAHPPPCHPSPPLPALARVAGVTTLRRSSTPPGELPYRPSAQPAQALLGRREEGPFAARR